MGNASAGVIAADAPAPAMASRKPLGLAGKSSGAALLPRARLRDVLRGRSPFIGARCDPDLPRGFISPVEARLRLGLAYVDALAAERQYQGSLFRNLGVAFRGLVAALLSARGEARFVPRPFIVSARVDAITISEATEEILTPHPGRAKTVFFAHPHALNLAYFDPALAEQLERADWVLPDGVGLRIAARILGLSLPHNLNGTDMLPLLCEGAARRGVPLALIGANPGVAEACAERLREMFPKLDIPIVLDGYLDHDASVEVAGRLRRMRQCVVLVAMGTPVQERWVSEHLSDIPNITAVTVGGLFDFFAGRIARAPVAWRELGLEWLFRLSKEPRRLAARYLIGNPLFIALVLIQRWRIRQPRA